MQHKSNTVGMKPQSYLSTTFSKEELKILKRKMPTNWVERIQEETGYSPARIREVLREPEKYNKKIIDAALDVAEAYRITLEGELSDQKTRFQALSTI